MCTKGKKVVFLICHMNKSSSFMLFEMKPWVCDWRHAACLLLISFFPLLSKCLHSYCLCYIAAFSSLFLLSSSSSPPCLFISSPLFFFLLLVLSHSQLFRKPYLQNVTYYEGLSKEIWSCKWWRYIFTDRCGSHVQIHVNRLNLISFPPVLCVPLLS